MSRAAQYRHGKPWCTATACTNGVLNQPNSYGPAGHTLLLFSSHQAKIRRNSNYSIPLKKVCKKMVRMYHYPWNNSSDSVPKGKWILRLRRSGGSTVSIVSSYRRTLVIPVQLCSWVSLWLIVLCAEKRILPGTKWETHTQLMINNDKTIINENLSAYHV